MKPKIPLNEIPPDVLKALLRLEAKRQWRESWEQQIEKGEQELDKRKETSHERE